ncbi:hypothetical protein F2Q68_00013526 [Brassica cretica]|uniref:Uncharacterized protein n=1 Tax=Brassica cretica TaxID=69181 RepID=A0A8S9HF74_BRACR|nr:hypothetical protein F2Q68_00013526 [Brassica cretica]
MTTHVVATSAIHSFKSEAVLKNEVKKRNLFIAFSFAFFKSETLCIMHNEVYEEERELISPQIHISVLKLLQKNTSRELNGVVQAMFRSMLAQEDEAHCAENILPLRTMKTSLLLTLETPKKYQTCQVGARFEDCENFQGAYEQDLHFE